MLHCTVRSSGSNKVIRVVFSTHRIDDEYMYMYMYCSYKAECALLSEMEVERLGVCLFGEGSPTNAVWKAQGWLD